MRVLDLNTLWIDGGEGGVNTYLLEKARWLADSSVLKGRKIQHVIVVPGSRSERSRIGDSTVHTIESPSLPGNPQHRVIIDYSRVRAILQAERPDVVEVDSSYLLGHMAARALRDRPFALISFYHVHLPRLYTRAGRSWLRTSLARQTEEFSWRYARYCVRPCDCVVVATHDLHDRLLPRSFPPIEIVPLGVNLQLFRPRANGVRPHLPGIDPSRPVVLYVGRLGREKDLQVLFDAHAKIESELGAQLLLAGDGPLRHRAERLAKSRRGVVCTGICPYGERLAELYRAADVLAVPGRNETFSLIVLEAWASGLPVVAANEGGPSELLRGVEGALAQAGDSKDFAAKLRLALERSRKGSPPACHRALTGYSWESTFTRLLEVYESVLHRKHRAAEALKQEPLDHKPTAQLSNLRMEGPRCFD